MAVAGIDVGSQSTKEVILEANQTLAAMILKTREPGASDARQAVEEAQRQARLKPEDLRCVVSTGTGRKNVAFAQQRSTVSCFANAGDNL